LPEPRNSLRKTELEVKVTKRGEKDKRGQENKENVKENKKVNKGKTHYKNLKQINGYK